MFLVPSDVAKDTANAIASSEPSLPPQWPSPVVTAATLVLIGTSVTPECACAADGAILSPTWNSALLAYGHYFFLLLATMLLMFERLTVAPNMSVDQEKSLVICDALYGVVGAALAATGYFRVVSGKGWEYYAHEPLFWMKLAAAGLLAGLSLFPTLIYIQRGSKLFQNEEIAPMSAALATRLQKILNAELSAVLSIPLLATLMARGIAFSPDRDWVWPLGAGGTVLVLLGSGALYARQALTWEEPEEL